MRADKLTVNGLFDPTERREAPLFQRPYVWTEEKNWEPLWESIKAVLAKRSQRLRFDHTSWEPWCWTNCERLPARSVLDRSSTASNA